MRHLLQCFIQLEGLYIHLSGLKKKWLSLGAVWLEHGMTKTLEKQFLRWLQYYLYSMGTHAGVLQQDISAQDFPSCLLHCRSQMIPGVIWICGTCGGVPLEHVVNQDWSIQKRWVPSLFPLIAVFVGVSNASACLLSWVPVDRFGPRFHLQSLPSSAS